MSSVQSNEVVCLPQEPQVHNEAQDLLLLQDYVHRLTNTREALLSEAGFENVFRTQNWARRRKLFCR